MIFLPIKQKNLLKRRFETDLIKAPLLLKQQEYYRYFL